MHRHLRLVSLPALPLAAAIKFSVAISVAVTLDTVFKILNSFFAVFAKHAGRGVLMATVTRVLAEVAGAVTGST